MKTKTPSDLLVDHIDFSSKNKPFISWLHFEILIICDCNRSDLPQGSIIPLIDRFWENFYKKRIVFDCNSSFSKKEHFRSRFFPSIFLLFPFLRPPSFLYFSELPTFDNIFFTKLPQLNTGKTKNELISQSYFFIFIRLQKNLTYFL